MSFGTNPVHISGVKKRPTCHEDSIIQGQLVLMHRYLVEGVDVKGCEERRDRLENQAIDI